MRLPILALAALLLAPAVLALPPPSLTPPLPSNSSILPLNALNNPGFESGLSGWSRYGHPLHPLPVVSPGAAGSSRAFHSVNQYYGGGIYQYVTPLDPVLNEVGLTVLLDFYAKAALSPAKTGYNMALAYAKWVPTTGAGETTAMVAFSGMALKLRVWNGPIVSLAAPNDGGWHHYQVVLLGGLGSGILLIDGIPAMDGTTIAIATGAPASVAPANVVILGDVSWCDCNGGPAPDVVYDEFYLGPAL